MSFNHQGIAVRIDGAECFNQSTSRTKGGSMKKRILTPVMLAGLLAMLAFVSVHAGTSGALTATVPFDFTIGETVLPAGSYSVMETSTDGCLLLRGIDSPLKIFVNTFNASPKGKAKPFLLFHRYDNRYFLARVEFRGGTARAALMNTEERELAAKSSQNRQASSGLHAELVYVDAQ
jgi:hypothetical protein